MTYSLRQPQTFRPGQRLQLAVYPALLVAGIALALLLDAGLDLRVEQPAFLALLDRAMVPAASAEEPLLVAGLLTEADKYWLTARPYLRTIAWSEGTYDTGREGSPYNFTYRYRKFDSYAAHPRIDIPIPGDLKQRTSDAAGAFQILSTTFDACKAAGVLDQRLEEFSPENQELCALYLSYSTGAETALHSGVKVDAQQRVTVSYAAFAEAITRDSREWASFPGANIGADSGQHTKELWQLWTRFNWELWGETGTRGWIQHPIGLQYAKTSPMGWRWGRMHRGLDYATPVGTPVLAPENGTFSYVNYQEGGAGHLFVFVPDSRPDMQLRGFHCTGEWPIQPGTHVKQGDLIAYTGNTGGSTGPHFHAEVLIEGEQVNPEIYLDQATWFDQPDLLADAAKGN